MTVRITAAGNQVPGTPAPASFGNSVAGGWIGYVERITDLTGIGATEATVLTVAPTFNANRYILLTAYYPSWISTVASDRAQMRILEGATQLMLGRSFADQAGVATSPPVVLQRWLVNPTPGSHTYTMTIARNSGSGALTLSGGTDGPTYFSVQDMGGVT